MIEPVKGWVISLAGNYHKPRNNKDKPETVLYNEERKVYYGFEGGFHFYASNAEGKPIANFGIYGDYNYAAMKHAWLIGIKTSIPVSL